MNQLILSRDVPPPLFDVGGALRLILHRWPVVLGVAAAVVGLAVLYVALTHPTYTATGAILVDPRDARTTSSDSVLPGIGSDSAAIASQVSVIQSRQVLEPVFAQFQPLLGTPEPSLSDALAGGAPKPQSSEAAFTRFQTGLSVEREGLTYVIDLGYKSQDPETAAAIVNAVIKRYVEYTSAEKSTATDEVSAVLLDKLKSLQDEVSGAERAVEDFKTRNGIFDAATGGTLQSQIDQLSAQILAAQDQASQAEGRYQQALAAGKSPQGLIRITELLTSPTADKLRDDYNQRALAVANARSTLGPRHPTLRRQQAELQQVEQLMEGEEARLVGQLKAASDLAAANLAKLRSDLDKLRGQQNQSGLAEVQLRQLQRNADAARTVLDDFLRRAQETSQAGGLQLSQVRVLSSAVAPPEPSWPKPMLILPVSVLLGLLGGCGLALLLGPTRVARLPRLPAPG